MVKRWFFHVIGWFEHHFLLSLVISSLIALIIFLLSSLTFEVSPGAGVSYGSFGYHFFVFFFLQAFLLMGFIRGKLSRVGLVFLIIVFSVFYGVSDEVHQLFVVGRFASLIDVLVNSLGILVNSFIYVLVLKSRYEN